MSTWTGGLENCSNWYSWVPGLNVQKTAGIAITSNLMLLWAMLVDSLWPVPGAVLKYLETGGPENCWNWDWNCNMLLWPRLLQGARLRFTGVTQYSQMHRTNFPIMRPSSMLTPTLEPLTHFWNCQL